jgi:hypothetical protein
VVSNSLSKEQRRRRPLSDRIVTARRRAEALNGRHCVACGSLCHKGGGCTRCGGESEDVAALKADLTRRPT